MKVLNSLDGNFFNEEKTFSFNNKPYFLNNQIKEKHFGFFVLVAITPLTVITWYLMPHFQF